MRARRRRHAHHVLASAAIAATLAACNALIGLDGDFSLSGKGGDDAATDGAIDSAIVDGADGGPGFVFDGSYTGCWEKREEVQGVGLEVDGPRWRIPNPKGVANVRNEAKYASPGGGVVRDEITGLEWVLEQDAGTTEDFGNAEKHCGDIGARLPQRMELVTIQDWRLDREGGVINPRIPMQDHSPSSADFWTATQYRGIQGQRWVLNFQLAFGVAPLNRTGPAHVKCVRDGVPREAGVGRAEISRACGLLRDLRTNLEWELEPSDLQPYGGAISRCNALNARFPGSDTPDPWRLPTYAEALSLVDSTRATAPAIFRPMTLGNPPKSGLYWTSSYAGGDTSVHLAVDADDGNASRTVTEPGSAHARCVHEFDPSFP